MFIIPFCLSTVYLYPFQRGEVYIARSSAHINCTASGFVENLVDGVGGYVSQHVGFYIEAEIGSRIAAYTHKKRLHMVEA